jgi:hypothetical protein
MLRSTISSPLAGNLTSHSLPSFPGISFPGRLNQGLEVEAHPKLQKTSYKEES